MRGDPLADPWWAPTRRKLLWLVGSVLAVVLVAAGVRWLVVQVGLCGPGVAHVDGECIGVTDGAATIDDTLADITKRISDENAWVEKDGRPYVSVAYLMSYPAGPNPSGAPASIRHQLEGAFVVQRRANRTNTIVGDTPLIKVLLANAGNRAEHWSPVVDDLTGRTGAPDNLRAVVGLGQSLTTTRKALAELARHHIPMVAAVLTADFLGTEKDQRRVDGLVRVAPTNTDEARAAAAYLKPHAARALLVQDTNAQDLYASTLGAAFRAEFEDAGHTLVSPVEQFDSSLPGVAGTFAQMMPDLCQQKPDAVYFAGRGEDLQRFVEALPRRTCASTLHVTIVTGDDAAKIPGILRGQLRRGDRQLQAGLQANATVQYTTLAHPDAWSQSHYFSSDPLSYLRDDCKDCFARMFNSESLDDGEAIMGHDALLLAVTAIRSTLHSGASTTTIGEVAQEWNRLHDTGAVAAGSGWISLDENGRPVDKAVPVLRLEPDGTARFVLLSAPHGHPWTPSAR